MTSSRIDLRGGFGTPRPARWVAAIAFCLGALSGCTNTPAQGDGGTTPSSPPQADLARFALEGTVQYLHQWSRVHLVQELKGLADRSGPIPRDARQRAMRKAMAGAISVHLGCKSVDAKLVRPLSTIIQIRANDCVYPVGPTASGTLPVAEGCVILAAPEGTVDAFITQEAQDPAGAVIVLVDSRAKAAPGTWYLGRCR